MTWMIIRLILSLAFIGFVLLFAARIAKKRGLGQGNGLIEVVARQRMGRSSSVNVVRIAEAVEAALAERSAPARQDQETTPGVPAPVRVARPSTGVLAGSVFDRNGWGSLVNTLRERTVRKS
jgi:flagellar protein FliO/FliZ